MGTGVGIVAGLQICRAVRRSTMRIVPWHRQMLPILCPASLRDEFTRILGQLNALPVCRGDIEHPQFFIPNTIAADNDAMPIPRDCREAIPNLAAAQLFFGSRHLPASRREWHT